MNARAKSLECGTPGHPPLWGGEGNLVIHVRYKTLASARVVPQTFEFIRNRNPFTRMIHNVYFWLKKDLPPADRTTFENELIRLKEISYLVHGFVGKPAPTEARPVTDHTFDYSLTLHFKNMPDHEHYQKTCEQHARFVKTCKSFWERLLVYDTSPIH